MTREQRYQAGIIQKHYRLNRPVTQEEVVAEVTNLLRKAKGGMLDDRAELLMASLDLKLYATDLRRSDMANSTGKAARKRSGTGGTRFAAKRAKQRKQKKGGKQFGEIKFSTVRKTASQFVQNQSSYVEQVPEPEPEPELEPETYQR